jgi:hypothetical protein
MNSESSAPPSPRSPDSNNNAANSSAPRQPTVDDRPRRASNQGGPPRSSELATAARSEPNGQQRESSNRANNRNNGAFEGNQHERKQAGEVSASNSAMSDVPPASSESLSAAAFNFEMTAAKNAKVTGKKPRYLFTTMDPPGITDPAPSQLTMRITIVPKAGFNVNENVNVLSGMGNAMNPSSHEFLVRPLARHLNRLPQQREAWSRFLAALYGGSRQLTAEQRKAIAILPARVQVLVGNSEQKSEADADGQMQIDGMLRRNQQAQRMRLLAGLDLKRAAFTSSLTVDVTFDSVANCDTVRNAVQSRAGQVAGSTVTVTQAPQRWFLFSMGMTWLDSVEDVYNLLQSAGFGRADVKVANGESSCFSPRRGLQYWPQVYARVGLEQNLKSPVLADKHVEVAVQPAAFCRSCGSLSASSKNCKNCKKSRSLICFKCGLRTEDLSHFKTCNSTLVAALCLCCGAKHPTLSCRRARRHFVPMDKSPLAGGIIPASVQVPAVNSRSEFPDVQVAQRADRATAVTGKPSGGLVLPTSSYGDGDDEKRAVADRADRRNNGRSYAQAAETHASNNRHSTAVAADRRGNAGQSSGLPAEVTEWERRIKSLEDRLTRMEDAFRKLAAATDMNHAQFDLINSKLETLTTLVTSKLSATAAMDMPDDQEYALADSTANNQPTRAQERVASGFTTVGASGRAARSSKKRAHNQSSVNVGQRDVRSMIRQSHSTSSTTTSASKQKSPTREKNASPKRDPNRNHFQVLSDDEKRGDDSTEEGEILMDEERSSDDHDSEASGSAIRPQSRRFKSATKNSRDAPGLPRKL